jgi:hypothetical protein
MESIINTGAVWFCDHFEIVMSLDLSVLECGAAFPASDLPLLANAPELVLNPKILDQFNTVVYELEPSDIHRIGFKRRLSPKSSFSLYVFYSSQDKAASHQKICNNLKRCLNLDDNQGEREVLAALPLAGFSIEVTGQEYNYDLYLRSENFCAEDLETLTALPHARDLLKVARYFHRHSLFHCLRLRYGANTDMLSLTFQNVPCRCLEGFENATGRPATPLRGLAQTWGLSRFDYFAFGKTAHSHCDAKAYFTFDRIPPRSLPLLQRLMATFEVQKSTAWMNAYAELIAQRASSSHV